MEKMSIRGISLFVKVVGKGYPLLLMHGGPSQDHTSLLPLQPLSDQFTLVYYDHRCNGRSDGIEVTSMTWENLTADAEAIRQELGFEKWAVLGHSFGGQVALEYALRYPERLTHLVLMNTGGDQWWVNHNGPEILARRGFSPDTVQAARRFFNGQVTTANYMSTVLKFNSGYFYHQSPIDMIRAFFFEPHPRFQPEALIFGYSQLLQGWTVMDRLGEIRAPTLVVAGRYDFLFPPESQAILADKLPNARLELIERAGHNPETERPVETISAIRNFFTANPPGIT